MFRFMQRSQWYLRLGMSGFGLLLAVILLSVAAAWYYHINVTGVSPDLATPTRIAIKNSSTLRPPELVQSEKDKDPLPIPPTTMASQAEPREPISSLEAQYHHTRVTADRIELASEIASWNDSAAVQAIGRLFKSEAHPEIKLALLSGLNDINSEAALDARLDVLTFALHGQPRNVRTAALDSLAQIDDPRIAALLKKVMTTDPDHEVRVTATALYEAVRQ